ncbi:chemotaxis signal transduction protein CheV [Campylobacter iguaniorum]|uniref:Chemotaxis signal transduction protein CheV n=1 Tax=Campylobacter iguaniorum TaxID=1244531 RepID=A0A076F7I7_9BACT|nr:chemotaxis protein [Campylobacter iguaniorum]AII14215.1 chemotaxis signal transduction protein CheV [Campylobacter iguaniorum]ALV23954.1 chemotaxis signal transduction protein CheV [Campylobacter iguaniorum]
MFDDNILKTGSNEMELVDFRILKQGKDKVYEGIYGVNVAKVKEIIKMPNLTELPGVPDYIEGIFDLRGVVIPVINLARWMNIDEPKDCILKPRVIIAEFSDIFIGFIVHEAKRIRRINWKDIEPANFTGGGSGTLDKSKITGVTRIENDEVLLILDLESIVEELGIYQPKIEMEVDEMKQLSGVALVLDDSLTARRLVGDALTKIGLRVVEAKDGSEGLEKMNDLYALYKDDLDQNLRVIISDIEMPQMDGFHFAASLKEDKRFANIPIIFNSSLSNEFSELHGKEAGADGYLTKFNATQLYKEVTRVVDDHKKYLDKR